MKYDIFSADVKLSPDVICQQVEGEMVLLDLGSDQYFALDSTATRIWALLQQGKSPVEVLQQMSSEFDVDIKTLTDDLAEHFDGLVEAGLIEVSA